MGSYIAHYRTSYFRVTDEARYKKLVLGINGGEFIDLTSTADGVKWHAFANDIPFRYYPELDPSEIEEFMKTHPDATETELKYLRIEGGSDIHAFFKELSHIVHQDDACVFIGSCFEALRFVQSYTFVVTRERVDVDSIESVAKRFLAKRLGEKRAKKIRLHF